MSLVVLKGEEIEVATLAEEVRVLEYMKDEGMTYIFLKGDEYNEVKVDLTLEEVVEKIEEVKNKASLWQYPGCGTNVDKITFSTPNPHEENK